MFSKLSKASVNAHWPFFIFLFSSIFFSNASLAGVASSTQWQKLNYFDKGFLLDTSSFLTSKNIDRATLQTELDSFVLLAKSDPSLACRYPARYRFLYQQNIFSKPLDYSQCPSLEEYMKKVPTEKFYYVFAAENITSVTSMMGHGFLMAEGSDASGKLRKHSFSFFAELNSLNPIYLFYGATISGLKGQFALHPYQKDLQQYLVREEREVWEYSLDLTKGEAELLKLVLWELKNVDFSYRFHSFNCATLILHILSIIKPEISDYEVLFVSPLDIAKALEEESLVKEVSVILPDSIINNRSESELDSYNVAKKPTLSPQDSLISMYSSSDELSVAILLTSHLLRTPSTYRNSISELRIGYLDFNITDQSLNEFALYGFKDYKAHSSDSYSSEIYIGYRPNFIRNIGSNKNSLATEYLLGVTKPIFNVQVSALLGASYENEAAVDSKISMSWPYSKNGNISYSIHNKRYEGKSESYYLLEASFILANKWNIFLSNESLTNRSDVTKVGLDYHF